MGIVYEYSNTEDLIYPVLLCDRCGERIMRAEDGTVLWFNPMFDGVGPWRTGTPIFRHKTCNDTHTPCDTIDSFMIQLQYRLSGKE